MVAPMPADDSDTRKKSGPAETPHYHGHRMRLRERFLGAGPDALSDYELLEMVLFRALPRRDVKPLAKSLIARIRLVCRSRSRAGDPAARSRRAR